MTDVRCPMCGKLNSDDLEVCQYCQARLKPLIAPPDDEATTRELSSAMYPADPRESEKEAEPESAIPDWLQSLRPDRDEEEYAIPPSAEEEPPAWTPHPDTGSLKQKPADAESDYRDWLSSLRADDESEAVPEARLEDTSIDWSTPEPEGEEAPGWLSDLRSTSEETSLEIPAAETAPLSSLENPDWLRQLRERQMGETEPAQDEEAQPDLAELSSEIDTGSEAFSEEPAEQAEEEEIPDWLSGLVDSPSDDHPDDLPDWLVSGSPPPTESATPALIEEPSEEGLTSLPSEAEMQIPDWLSGIMNSQTQAATDELPLEEEIPGWLTGKEKLAVQKQGPAEPEGEVTGAEFEWLEAQGLIAPEKKPADSQPKVVAPFTMEEETAGLDTDELPDWLKEAGAQEAQLESVNASEEDASLTPAALPAWLEAMRPVEAAAPGVPRVDESERSIESSGPLAGLRGILRAEPDIARQKKPPAYTIKLQVSESHQAHAAILEKLINSEGVVTPVPARAVVSRQMLWRAAILVILLLAAAWPLYSGSQGVALPQLPNEVFSARAVIDGLLVDETSNQGAVLLAVDYEPGFAGEMDAASAALLDHLMIKGTHLALVSTTPSGPALAERLVSIVNQHSNHQYSRSNQYVNLGFVPGGAAGLLGFAQSPQRVLPYTLDGSDAWNDGLLAGITNLSDFSLAIVITENPDTARAWIEQAQPALGGKPLLLVVSAQAEPLVRPYFEGYPQQVQGMLVGLAGGAAYENSMQRSSLARQYWDSYSFTLAAAILIIVIASALNALPLILSRGKKVKGEA